MKKAENIDEYIDQYPKNIQDKLVQMRRTIRNAAPKATETISYSMPAFKINRVIVWFAGFKTHIGFYPGANGIAKFKHELSRYKHSKGAVQFPLDQPLPLSLVTRMVKFRVDQDDQNK